ncbi:hypothetical protein AGMMS50239_06180 [Bacteroidia bacterium]|nr:hypothetical protein AGMMS50239_06180 [Bacteroidia bacterium]
MPEQQNIEYKFTPESESAEYKERLTYSIEKEAIAFLNAKAIRTSLADYKEETWMTNVPLYAIGIIN